MAAAGTVENIVLNIGDMIDMAIGTPEVGVVDFNMLQTVLHCLAQQQQILGKPVEVRGVAVPANAGRDNVNVSTINIREFAVGTDGKPPVPKVQQPTPNDTILVVERVKKTDSASSTGSSGGVPKPTTQPSAGGPSQAAVAAAQAMSAGQVSAGSKVSSAGKVGSAGKEGSAGQTGAAGQMGTAGQVGAAGQLGAAGQAGSPGQAAPGQDGLTLVTYSKFNLLESTVQDLQKRVYGSIPKNEEILEEVRSQTNIKAIQDMWTNLNVSARLEAAEAGIDKLSSLVQDVINETTALQDTGKAMGQHGGVIPGAVGGAGVGAGAGAVTGDSQEASTPGATPSDRGAASTTSGPGGLASDGEDLPPSASKADLDGMTEYVTQIRNDLDNLTDLFYNSMKQVAADIELPPPPEHGPNLEDILAPRGGDGGTDHGGGGSGAGSKSGKSSRQGKSGQQKSKTSGIDGDVLEVMERLNDLEKRVERCCQMLGKGEGVVSDQLNSFQDQLEYLTKQVAGITNISAGTMSPDLIKDLQGLMQLFQTVQEMQDQLKQVHETALQLVGEKEDRKHHINVLLEQIELLKTIKLDREDMAEAMAEKADLRMLARKVSHDQFELACDDLSRGLEHALGKLNMQEALWQQALDDIQREIETKLDKMELSPVKEFFNSKLKLLQDSLKQMASLRREAEAAGTKRKLLRDVNCLSCDANAMMATEAPPSMPVPKPFPAALSMKPYLSYELDTIRKTQASNLPQRNMHDWENIDKQMAQPKQQFKVRSGVDKHLCNRYCGGSHTTTTPAQRVARLGHFIKQWGPDVLPLSSGLAAGDDGRMYRVQAEGDRVGPGGAVDTTCTPKIVKKPELPQISSERVLGDDCRCMEPATGAKK